MDLSEILKSGLKAIESANDETALKNVERELLGKEGLLMLELKKLKDLPDEEKRVRGPELNQTKIALEAALKTRLQTLELNAINQKLENDWVDPTLPGDTFTEGHIHPLYQIQEEVEQIFQEMGFRIIDGPEVETEFYNFESLNVPAHHPARDMQDTFFIDAPTDPEEGRLVLRTQTSPNQVRAMREYGVPLRMIVPGRVFRNEATDASHEHTFDQVEGFLVDKDISIAHLKGVMEEFLMRLFKKPTRVRFRPGYFPFVEPGMELDMSCPFCNEQGCRVCKKTGWIEFMGCGMVHPHVLKSGGVNPDEYQGWAFGFGLTRLVMMRTGINDIRYLSGGDLRIYEQF